MIILWSTLVFILIIQKNREWFSSVYVSDTYYRAATKLRCQNKLVLVSIELQLP